MGPGALALVMGAAANYGWHLYHLKPVEQQVEVKEVVTPPLRAGRTQAHDHPAAAAPAGARGRSKTCRNPGCDYRKPGGQSLAERLMAALNNTPLVEESAPQAQVQTSAIPSAPWPRP